MAAQAVVVDAVLSILISPYRRTFKLYTFEPIRESRELSRKGDQKLLVQSIRDFKAGKYGELQSVQVAVRSILRVPTNSHSFRDSETHRSPRHPFAQESR